MPEIGDLIGPYRLVAPLGKGAMGEVWRARDERLDRHVALKVMPPEIDRDVERRSRMLREAKAAAAIRHANVVTLFDVVKHAGDDILVMELVEGRTLSEALRKDGPPPLETAVRWITGVAEALVAAHARGILHRDIKAANVMVTPDGDIKVLDFGLAKIAEDAIASPTTAERRRPAHPAQAVALDATMPSSSGAMAAPQPVALDATMPSTSQQPPGAAIGRAADDIASYRTHAGQLIGTPVYMAPEQIDGAAPDERSEVFSVGVLAYEILTGKPPYSALTIDALFVEILNAEPPPIESDRAPAGIAAIVMRALAKVPAERLPTMAALRDALAAERARLFSPPARGRWPWIAGAAVVALAGAIVAWRIAASHAAEPSAPLRPGDKYVQRALEEYDAFANDQMMGSLHSALAIAPDHPLANAYVILFGYAADAERTRALDAARRARAQLAPDEPRTRALLDTAIALQTKGPVAAIATLAAAGLADRELTFWAAELAYRAGDYAAAHDAYRAMLAEPAGSFRGRIYDHYSSVLLYVDEPAEAERIGALYHAAMPAEADAIGVYATTLAANGKPTEARALAAQASALRLDEDTLAGEAKVAALAGDRKRAEELYARSIAMPTIDRRPMRRAALGLLQWMDGDDAAARATTAPCLPGGDDADNPRRGGCLFVGAVIDPTRADAAIRELANIAATYTPTHPPYGAPATLAALIRARTQFFGGGCVKDIPPAATDQKLSVASLEAAYAMPLDFYASYHIPFFQTYALCEHAALLHALANDAAARALLTPVARRAPNRTWLLEALVHLSGP